MHDLPPGTVSVSDIIDTLNEPSEITVRSAGETILSLTTGGTVSSEEFRNDPQAVGREVSGVVRYLAQIAWRALQDDYRDVDEVVEALKGAIEGAIEPAPFHIRSIGQSEPELITIPRARVLRVRRAEKAGTAWLLTFEALVTGGDLEGREVIVHASSADTPDVADTIAMLWIHASVALYNLLPRESQATKEFTATRQTFVVVEPLLQVNATAIARGLLCPKPHVDRLRRGSGDVTVHTLKGLLVHRLWDRLVEGEDDVERAYRQSLPTFMVDLAAIAVGDFDERKFHEDVLRHGKALRGFIDRNSHVREGVQVEVGRYSTTFGIQGRIDAVFRRPDGLDVVELKTGRRLRDADYAQLEIYRLLLGELLEGEPASGSTDRPSSDVTARLLSSIDGSSTPLERVVGFREILRARNRLAAHSHGLGRERTHFGLPYAGFDDAVCGRCPSWTVRDCRRDSALFGDHPASPPDPARAYFNRMTRAVQRERRAAERALSDLLDDGRLAERVRQFRTIVGAKCIDGVSGVFEFEFPRNTSDLGGRDRVLIHTGNISRSESFHGYVREIGVRRARIAIPVARLAPEALAGREWIIDRFPTDMTSGPSQTGLYDWLRAASGERKSIVLGDFPSSEASAAPSTDDAPPRTIQRTEPLGSLNSSQAMAVSRAVGAKAFHLIWGPPGTGKTRVIAEIVRRTPGSVLLAASTNTAVDKMLLALLAAAPELEFLRIGSASDSAELADRLGDRAMNSFSQNVASRATGIVDMKRRLDRVRILATTAHRAAVHPYVRSRSFDLAVVDEASQLTEPMTLGVIMRAARFVLVGDDRQLPPVARDEDLRRSMFERLKEAVAERAPQRLTLLDVQYRMHPEIMKLSNRLYYSGRLLSGVRAGDRSPIGGGPVRFIPVDAEIEGRSNPAEVVGVKEEVAKLLAEGLAPGQIGVIAPFRAQVFLLREALEAMGVIADTVERFQGGEREAIVISLVRSRSSRFVFDDRRFNVAITRAKSTLILVGHPRLWAGRLAAAAEGRSRSGSDPAQDTRI